MFIHQPQTHTPSIQGPSCAVCTNTRNTTLLCPIEALDPVGPALSSIQPFTGHPHFHLSLIPIAHRRHSSRVDLYLTLNSSRGQKRPINISELVRFLQVPGSLQCCWSTEHAFSSKRLEQRLCYHLRSKIFFLSLQSITDQYFQKIQ